MKLSYRVSIGMLSRGLALLLVGWLASPSLAAVTNDRDYRFGDPGTSDGDLGATVSEGNPIGFLFSGGVRTADETGPSAGPSPDLGGFIDLLVPDESDLSHTGPTYTDSSSRPLGAAGSFGVRFDGVDDLLTGQALNRPDEFATRIEPSTYPFNFTGITARGLQMWVRPDQAGLDAGVRQAVIMDTIAAGGVAITAEGNWTQMNDGHANDTDIGATIAVAGDTWSHVMHHVYPSSDPNAPSVIAGTGSGDLGFSSVVYVNGVAVSANNDSPNPGDFSAGGRVGVLTVGAAELTDQDGDTATADYGEFFDGTVDDLQMYVFGDNTSDGGQNYGSFDLFADNEWIANEISKSPLNGTLLPGDVNRDGAVTQAGDVPAFVAGWLSVNRLEGAHNDVAAGDWNTWGQGDMNHDGITNLDDAFILHEALVLASGVGLDFSLLAAAAVPEPSTLSLLGVVIGGLWLRRR